MFDEKTLQLLGQLGIGVIALYTLIRYMQLAHSIRVKELDAATRNVEVQKLSEANEAARIAKDREIELKRAATEQLVAATQQMLVEQSRENQLVIADNTKATQVRTQAAMDQAQAMDRMAQTFQTSTSSLATLLTTAQKESADRIADKVDCVQQELDTRLDTLTQDNARVKQDHVDQQAAFNFIGQKLDLHSRAIDETRSMLSQRFDALPQAVADELAPLLARWDKLNETVDSLPEQIAALEKNLIAVFERVAPPQSHTIAQFEPQVTAEGALG